MSQKSNPPAQEDTWAFQPIESPFPNNAVKVQGQQNMFVALWYKNGKPVHGYAWNNGGLVQASFPYGTAEMTGKTNLGDRPIQVLQYTGDHNTLGFWYEWVNYKELFDKTNDELVRCGHSMPILWTNRPGGPLLGSLDMNSQEAFFSSAGKAEKLVGKPLEDMLIIVRNLQGGPADCVCHNCSLKKPPPTTKQLIQLNKQWVDNNANEKVDADQNEQSTSLATGAGCCCHHQRNSCCSTSVTCCNHGRPCSISMSHSQRSISMSDSQSGESSRDEPNVPGPAKTRMNLIASKNEEDVPRPRESRDNTDDESTSTGSVISVRRSNSAPAVSTQQRSGFTSPCVNITNEVHLALVRSNISNRSISLYTRSTQVHSRHTLSEDGTQPPSNPSSNSASVELAAEKDCCQELWDLIVKLWSVLMVVGHFAADWKIVHCLFLLCFINFCLFILNKMFVYILATFIGWCWTPTHLFLVASSDFLWQFAGWLARLDYRVESQVYETATVYCRQHGQLCERQRSYMDRAMEQMYYQPHRYRYY